MLHLPMLEKYSPMNRLVRNLTVTAETERNFLKNEPAK